MPEPSDKINDVLIAPGQLKLVSCGVLWTWPRAFRILERAYRRFKREYQISYCFEWKPDA